MHRHSICAVLAIATAAIFACSGPVDDGSYANRRGGGDDYGKRSGSTSTKEDDLESDSDWDDDLPKREPEEEEQEADDAGAPAPEPPPPDAAPPVTAFGNAPPYAPITPPTQSARHDGYKSNAGQDCIFCHDGKTPGVPRFLIAGTVYATQGSTVGARNVQVRVVAPNGDEVALVGTDEAGNFWLKAGALNEIPLGSVVGVRNALSTKLMGGRIGGASVSAGACNRAGCHSPGKGIYVD